MIIESWRPILFPTPIHTTFQYPSSNTESIMKSQSFAAVAIALMTAVSAIPALSNGRKHQYLTEAN
jgi:hypothetical protein